MSADIIPIGRPETVDEAWEIYAALVREVEADHKLVVDRRHCERRVRTHGEFARLYSALDPKDNVVAFRRRR